MDTILHFLPYRSYMVAAQECSSHALLSDSESVANGAPSWYPRRFIRANRRPIERHWRTTLGGAPIVVTPRRDVTSELNAQSISSDSTKNPARFPYELSGHHRYLFRVSRAALSCCVSVEISDSNRYPLDAEATAAWLQQTSVLESLVCRTTRLHSASFVAMACPRLGSLDVERSEMDEDGLTGVEKAPHLHTLNAAWVMVKNIDNLGMSTTLVNLNLRRTRVDCVSALEKVPTLEVLLLDHSRVRCIVSDLAMTSPVKYPALRTLSICSTPIDSRALGAVGDAPKLQTIVANDCPNVDDIDGLTRSTSLVELSLRDTPVTNTGIRHLARVPTLQRLVLSNTRVTDLNGLAKSPALREVEAFFLKMDKDGVKALLSTEVVVRLAGDPILSAA